MTIYQKLKRIAKHTVKQYLTDLTVHDLKALRSMKPGDRALWSCRTYGTNFVWLARHDDMISRDTLESYRDALNYFDAVANVFGNEDGASQWYLLEKIGDAVLPMTADEARELFVRRIRGFEDGLKRAA